MSKFWISCALAALAAGALTSCGSSSSTEEADTGIITVVREVADGEFRIEDEQIAPTKSASAIIAKYADNTIDTIPLSEAQLVMSSGEAASDTSRHYYRRNSLVTMASYGLMGYMLGRRMGSFSPMPSAYVDPQTHQRVNNTTGNTFRNATARQTSSSPSKGRSGYGGGSSTRSSGG
jgi:hypothetical protein